MAFDFVSLIPAAAAVASSVIGANAQKKGINNAQATTRQGQAEAYGFLDEGREGALDAVTPLIAPGDDARTYLRTAMASNPAMLRPSQKIALDDTIRQTKQGLAAGGLRGAGRAGTAVLGDVTGRTIARFQDQNQQRSDRSATTLEGRGAQARTNVANIEQQTGASKAASATGTASNIARLDTAAGQVGANLAGDLGYSAGAATPGIVDLIGALGKQENRDQYA